MQEFMYDYTGIFLMALMAVSIFIIMKAQTYKTMVIVATVSSLVQIFVNYGLRFFGG